MTVALDGTPQEHSSVIATRIAMGNNTVDTYIRFSSKNPPYSDLDYNTSARPVEEERMRGESYSRASIEPQIRPLRSAKKFQIGTIYYPGKRRQLPAMAMPSIYWWSFIGRNVLGSTSAPGFALFRRLRGWGRNETKLHSATKKESNPNLFPYSTSGVLQGQLPTPCERSLVEDVDDARAPRIYKI